MENVFVNSKGDFEGKPIYHRFAKTDNNKGVPPPINDDYTPKPEKKYDESLFDYRKWKNPETLASQDYFIEFTNCQSNDSKGFCEKSSETSVSEDKTSQKG